MSMVVRKRTLQIAAVIAGAGLFTSVYVIVDHKRKDKLAASLIQELNKLFSPTTSGLTSEEAFDVHYAGEVARKIKNVLVMKAELATRYANDIRSAWGIFNDDEDKVYTVFRSLKDKVQVSQVAKAYKDAYKINLIDELRNKMSSGEISQVLKIVNGLPRYRVVS